VRVGVFIVAYNAVTTLASVLERIPESFRPSIDVVLVSDDFSTDETYEVGVAYQRENAGLPITMIRQRRNLGYGGNQKFGYRWLIEHDIDVAVLLHGDGQYAPELLPELVAPILRGEADVVLGSRMLKEGALAGGMPLYKYVGNKILTRFQNRLSGLHLSEWHSGYRGFSLAALAKIPFEENADGFHFDTEVLLQLYDSGARIAEVPIPTYYGDEICRVNGLAYAKDASHQVALGMVAGRPPGRVLDLGCGSGLVAAELRRRGQFVVGVDSAPEPETAHRVDRLVTADLDAGLPDEAKELAPFDAVVAADVLEHLRAPDRLLRELHEVCTPETILVVSVPNISHWYPRLRIGLGRFDYDHRGILDATHMRFFTWRSFVGLAYRAGWRVELRRVTGLPLEILEREGGPGLKQSVGKAVRAVDRVARGAWPSLFAYQYVAVLSRDPARLPAEEPARESSAVASSG
jgi:SAM-dependent methyltransferase